MTKKYEDMSKVFEDQKALLTKLKEETNHRE